VLQICNTPSGKVVSDYNGQIMDEQGLAVNLVRFSEQTCFPKGLFVSKTGSNQDLKPDLS
jgi:hypothetical protein